jgi:CTP:molybdopterin cytidylyltransferase MocA
MKPSEISAVILAAGYSSRMGFFKPLSMLDGRVALEWAVRSVTGAV